MTNQLTFDKDFIFWGVVILNHNIWIILMSEVNAIPKFTCEQQFYFLYVKKSFQNGIIKHFRKYHNNISLGLTEISVYIFTFSLWSLTWLLNQPVSVLVTFESFIVFMVPIKVLSIKIIQGFSVHPLNNKITTNGCCPASHISASGGYSEVNKDAVLWSFKTLR